MEKGGNKMEETKENSNHHSIFPMYQLSGSFTTKGFNEEESLISKTVEQFVGEIVTPKLEAMEVHDYEVGRQLFYQAGELGLLGADVPEAYGGGALGKKISGLIAEKMGFGGSFSVSFNIHTGVGILPYVYFGTEKQKKTYLPKLVSGEWVGSYALTEPHAGSDALAMNTTATLNKEADVWILNGEKQWITNAHIASVYVVFSRTKEGITAFIVERTMPGVSLGPEEKKLGIKGSSTATLILDDVRIPKENMLGKVGEGHHIALNILNLARLKLAFANIGTAKQALKIAVRYGKERKQFQTAIADFPIIQEKIANMTVMIYGAESAAYYTANLFDCMDISLTDADDVNKKLSVYAVDCALNKINSSEALDFIVDETLQIHGGYGYMQDYEIERLYRDARINRIFEGTNEINRLTVAKAILKQYYQDQATFKQDEIGLDRNSLFIKYSVWSLQLILKALPVMSRKEMDQEQEYLRLLADVVQEIYVMKASLLRTEQVELNNNESVQQLVTEVLCEEGFRRVKNATETIISAITSDDNKKEALFDEIGYMSVPLYSNLFLKKRKIAQQVIKGEKYCL